MSKDPVRAHRRWLEKSAPTPEVAKAAWGTVAPLIGAELARGASPDRAIATAVDRLRRRASKAAPAPKRKPKRSKVVTKSDDIACTMLPASSGVGAGKKSSKADRLRAKADEYLAKSAAADPVAATGYRDRAADAYRRAKKAAAKGRR